MNSPGSFIPTSSGWFLREEPWFPTSRCYSWPRPLSSMLCYPLKYRKGSAHIKKIIASSHGSARSHEILFRDVPFQLSTTVTYQDGVSRCMFSISDARHKAKARIFSTSTSQNSEHVSPLTVIHVRTILLSEEVRPGYLSRILRSKNIVLALSLHWLGCSLPGPRHDPNHVAIYLSLWRNNIVQVIQLPKMASGSDFITIMCNSCASAY